MERRRLTDFDVYPEAMTAYMRYYGPHFNKKLCEFAVGKMEVEDKEGNIYSANSFSVAAKNEQDAIEQVKNYIRKMLT